MHILLTSDAVGGVWTYTLALTQSLQAMEAQCTILSLGPRPSEKELLRAEMVGLDVRCIDAPLEWTASNEEEMRQAARIIKELARSIDAHAIHLHSPAFAAFGLDRPCVGVNHSCVATWWHVMRGTPLPRDLIWRADLNRRGMLACDRLVVPSGSYAALVQAVYHLPKIPTTMYNGMRAPAATETVPGPFLFAAGRLWDEAKNIGALEAVAAQLREMLHVAGPLTSPLGDHYVPHHLHHMGQCSWGELQMLLAKRPIFISPALFEPFGLSVLEAASHGCPLVLNDIDTFRELWDGAALFIDITKSTQVASQLEGLLVDHEQCVALGEQARLRAEHYSLQSCAQSVFALHQNIICEVVS